MRMLGRVALATALLVPMVAAPAQAQSWKWDLGVNGGFAWYRGMLGSDDTGLPDGSDRDDVRFEAGPRFGAQLGYWFSPKLGLRLNATYASADVNDISFNNDTEHFSNVNLWSGTADLLFRFHEPNESWMGREMLPYFALGLGAKWHNPSNDEWTCVDTEENKSWTCHPYTPTEGTAIGNSFALGEQKVLSGLIALGTDIRLARNFAIRLELNDRIYKPQNHVANRDIEPGNRVTLPNGDDNVSQIVHEIGADLGLHLLMGLAPEPVVVVAPPPAPVAPPPPPVVPPPAPRPTTESVTVCVVDPTAPGGLRMQTMTYRIQQRDTVINDQPYRSALGNVMVARNADWYVRGQPLVITMGNERIEYTVYQGAVTIEPAKLSYLGTVNGYPVYADRDEVADVMDALNSVRRAEARRDLGEILAERRDLRDELEDVKFLYVPLEPANCIFQPVQLMEQVRKGKQ